MAYLLDQNVIAQCTHGGSAKPLAGNPRVKINGTPVLTVASQLAVSGCPSMIGTSPFPCVLAAFAAGAARVKVAGQPVLLDSSQATTTPTGVSLTLTSAQQRVKGA
jgi:uncharacterized Zn-binding protein involved in type VI secretion